MNTPYNKPTSRRPVMLLFLLAFTGTVFYAGSQTTHRELPLDLDLALVRSLALEHNPGLRRAQAALEEQEGSLVEIHAAARPRVDATGQYLRFDNERLQSFGMEDGPLDSRWDVGIEGIQTIYAGGRTREAEKGQKARIQSAINQAEAARQNLLVQAHSLFWDALLTREREQVQKEHIQILEEQLQLVRNRLESGRGAQFDVLQAEVALANARPDLIRAQNDYRHVIEALRGLIGLPYPPRVDARDITLIPPPVTESLSLALDDALLAARANRPDLQSAMQDLEAAHRQWTLAGLARRPVVDLFAAYGVESDQFNSDEHLKGWTAGTRLRWTWLDSGAVRGRVTQARARTEQVKQQLETLFLNAEQEVRQAYLRHEEATSILQSTPWVIRQAEEALQLSRNRYHAGLGTQLEVLESQLQLSRARLEHLRAQHALNIARVQIRHAVGDPL